MKTCSKCKEGKPLESFPRHRQHKDGRGSICSPCARAESRNWYQANRGKAKEYHLKYRQEEGNRAVHNAYYRKRRADARGAVLAAYGNQCACCGESESAFLVVDHINGGGTKERRARGNTYRLHVWLIKNDFPKDAYQLLCHNCNMAKGAYGRCPHAKD